MKLKISGFAQKTNASAPIEFWTGDMTEYGWLMVGPVEVEIDYEPPAGWNPVASEIETLNKKLDAINESHGKQVNAIQRRINDLLCIEMSPQKDES